MRDFIDSREGFDSSEYEAWLDQHDSFDCWANDVDADADTLASAGYGTDEDYGDYGQFDDGPYERDFGWDG